MEQSSTSSLSFIRTVSSKLDPIVFNDICRKEKSGINEIDIHSKYQGCTNCRLHATRTLSIAGAGPYTANILVIGEAPGPDEDIVGIPFIGRAGKLLRTVFEKLKVDSVYFTNAVACIPKDTTSSSFRTPEASEILACRNRIDEVIDLLPNLELIITLGKIPYVSLFYGSNEIDINKHIRTIKMQEIIGTPRNYKDIPVFANFHPSYIERQGKGKEIMQNWVDTFKLALNSIKGAQNA